MGIHKNLKTILDYLGDSYTTKLIDFENCAYRKINRNYDIEVSGCSNKKSTFRVYVWDISKGTGIDSTLVESSRPLTSLESLKSILDNYVEKYSLKNK